MPDPSSNHDLSSENLISLQSHILSEERHYPGATGDFSWILSAVALATKTIANKVRRARIEDVLGEFGDNRNVHDEQQQKLDVIANEIIKACLGKRANIGALVSEEDEEPTVLRTHADGGRYAVLFDPLDGSSNLPTSPSASGRSSASSDSKTVTPPVVSRPCFAREPSRWRPATFCTARRPCSC